MKTGYHTAVLWEVEDRVGRTLLETLAAGGAVDPSRLPRPAPPASEPTAGGWLHLTLTHEEAEPPTRHLAIFDLRESDDRPPARRIPPGVIELALISLPMAGGWTATLPAAIELLGGLGIQAGLILLTGPALAGSDEPARVEQIRTHLRPGPFAEAPILRVAGPDPAAIESLRSALMTLVQPLQVAADLGKPRLWVDAVSAGPESSGSVVTGILVGGRLHRGASVVLQPSGRSGRVEDLQHAGGRIEAAEPGMHVVVTLTEVDPRSAIEPTGAAAGQVLTLAELGPPHDTFDVRLEPLEARDVPTTIDAWPAPDGALVRLQHGTALQPARLRLARAEGGNPGLPILAELRLGHPAFLFVGDRILLRETGGDGLLAAGVVLEANADRRRWGNEEQQARLRSRADHPGDCDVFLLTELARDGACRRDQVLRQSPFPAAEIEATAAVLVERQQVVIRDPLLFSASWWHTLRRGAEEAIEFEHRAHPERPGLSLSHLRTALKPALRVPGVFELLLADLEASGYVRVASAIGRQDHQLALPAHLAAAGARIRGILLARPLDPPARKELIPTRSAFEALRFLLNRGEAVPVGPDLVIAAGAYRRAKDHLLAHLAQSGPASESDVRQVMHCTRRLFEPLCAKLVEEGVIRREGSRLRLP